MPQQESDEKQLIELRFYGDAKESVDACTSTLKPFVLTPTEEGARDPTIAAALALATSATTLIIELIKLAKELRSKGSKSKILVVKLGHDNRETSIPLLESTDDEISSFISDE